MGYQECMISTSLRTLKQDFEKLQAICSKTDDVSVVDKVATIQNDVKLYEFGADPEDWVVKLSKGDMFLVVGGDRHYVTEAIIEFGNRPSYPIETIMRCNDKGFGKDVYDNLFYEEKIEDDKEQQEDIDI